MRLVIFLSLFCFKVANGIPESVCASDRESLNLLQSLMSVNRGLEMRDIRGRYASLSDNLAALGKNMDDFERSCQCGDSTFVASGRSADNIAKLERLDLTLSDYMKMTTAGQCPATPNTALLSDVIDLLSAILPKNATKPGKKQSLYILI